MKTPEQEEWDEMLEETWNGLPKHLNHRERQREAHRLMMKHHGPRPKGMPLWLRLGAGATGQGGAVKRAWRWASGKKTLIGSILVGVPVIWETLQGILAAGGVDQGKLVAVGSVLLLVVGWAHKIAKVTGLASKE